MSAREPIDDPGEVCPECKRPYANEQPRDWRDPGLCYVRLQGRSRRAERSCAGHTIRRLQKRVRELEAWQLEVRITHKIGGTIAEAIGIADASQPSKGSL